MEDVYVQQKYRLLHTKRIDMKTLFLAYGTDVSKYFKMRKKREGLKLLLDINDDEEFANLAKVMDPKSAKYTSIPKSYVPKRRFVDSWALYELPLFETNLDTINNIAKETREEKYQRMKATKYQGKIILEVERDEQDHTRVRNMFANSDYVICIRVMSKIGANKSYMTSQEMLATDKITLDRVKDRIICEEDYQYAYPSVNKPDQPNPTRKMDVSKYGMFYIGNTFYVDKRFGSTPEHDYSADVLDWMPTRGLKKGDVKEMETSALADIPLRLGYPYLYMHQGKCEHLIIITDARLLKWTDLPFLEDYPLLSSFACLKGRFCILCRSRLAKLCVTQCDQIPYDNAFVCNLCTLSFLYDRDGNKKSNFSLYKYIDRTAIL